MKDFALRTLIRVIGCVVCDLVAILMCLDDELHNLRSARLSPSPTSGHADEARKDGEK